ncbi:SDR family NAD(P)-dependent oxidoreductase [Pseudomonas typographi]|uniref:SDR family oxidoreductase n=1 Tax=Pseudomonas typographi TaxID=2715964 RepID=A0ABR7Z180_9PSED|nr:SDR family oxidoreductase [Pseudomonas typographi]MBD1554819.1 SDR family oxidoreductase [Pseudomonas typographi]MBD1587342.1 SDR family oxidoreductase [Pseudomonas typographi]MBD1599162.1 SDR family oxidoreductase [Pseudomonas typographi]
MKGRLKNRVAIIIGAAKGIGAAMARRFVEQGARVVLADLDADSGERLLAELPPERAVFVRANVAVEADMQAVADLALARFGRIDILLQNAGIYPSYLLEDMTLSQWQDVLAVNLTGSFLATRACLPAMRAQGGGKMVFTSSITGPRVANPGVAAYASSKAGINGLIRSAALEFARYGITVNGIEPGNILTEGLSAGRSPSFISNMEKSIPLGRLGLPDDVAHAALFLASDEAAYITGTTIVVDGGQTLPESKDFADPAAWQ